jgi:magnesium-transporting ATPase (P-type)
MLGAFGLRDNLRSGIADDVEYARDKGKMNVRLISGDHIETATAVARRARILTPEDTEDKDQERAMQKKDYAVMHADVFEEAVGGLDDNWNPGDPRKFEAIMRDLRVLARAKPHHKRCIV